MSMIKCTYIFHKLRCRHLNNIGIALKLPKCFCWKQTCKEYGPVEVGNFRLQAGHIPQVDVIFGERLEDQIGDLLFKIEHVVQILLLHLVESVTVPRQEFRRRLRQVLIGYHDLVVVFIQVVFALEDSQSQWEHLSCDLKHCRIAHEIRRIDVGE